MTPEERIAELEKKLADQAAELEKQRSALEQNDEALDAWKRGHRSRPGGKKAQRTVGARRAVTHVDARAVAERTRRCRSSKRSHRALR